MDFDKATTEIKSFLLEAGELALRKQKTAKRTYKEGQQALTETDLAVSKLAQERLSFWLNQPKHLLIDEESIRLTPQQAFSEAEYLWVLDPIDGTAGYALGRKLWGISLGLLHDGIPVLGGIYLPALQQLLITENNQSYCLNLAHPEEDPVLLTAQKMEINSQIFVESYGSHLSSEHNPFSGLKIWLNTPESAVQGFASALTNQSAGATLITGATDKTGYSIWDVAAAAALAKHSGHKILSTSDAREWAKFSASNFKENWKLAESWMLVHPENFHEIREAIYG